MVEKESPVQTERTQMARTQVTYAQAVRIVHFPDCRLVTSGIGAFGDASFALFEKWFSAQTAFSGVYSYDFLTDSCGAGLQWLYAYDERMQVPDELEVIDFTGGYYAIVTAIDASEDSYAAAMTLRDDFLDKHGLVIDENRWELGHILTGAPLSQELFGGKQMDYWTPIRKT